MLDVIEKLLILQDRDRKIARVQRELSNIEPERRAFQTRHQATADHLEAAKLKVRQLETERKKLELEVEEKKQLIHKYSIQQFQTKKNDEYRALANEIDSCKKAISELEDRQLEFMEKIESAQAEVNRATQLAGEVKKLVASQVTELEQKEKGLQGQLQELQSNYADLTGAVEDSALNRYERLRKSKGDNPLVGIEHSVCGGCHMKLPTQIVVSCQAQRELISCPNCGRLLYYAPHMDLAVAE